MGWINLGGLAMVVFLGQVHPVQAQGRIKTMLEQVAALQGYIVTAEKGYQIAEDGIHLVRDIKSGEFDLHSVFFGSLSWVDEGVLRMPALAEARMYIVLLGDMASSEREALRVLTMDGGLSMTDGERLREIEGIRNQLKEKYGQVKRINAVRDWLQAQLKKEESYLQTLKKLYGLQ